MTPVELPFAFYGRVSTEDLQDPRASAAWQKGLSTQLIQPFGGKITSEFFDVGMSRSIPWRRRPHASRLLDDLPNPNRGYSRVVIGEPQRAFYDSQFGQIFPLFNHHGVELWVPEVGGRIDPDNDIHELMMTIFGGLGRVERKTIQRRVKMAMRTQTAIFGKYLGGRPPYGYQVVDDGPHPNTRKAAEGYTAKKLVTDPETARVVVLIFEWRRAGVGYGTIADRLNKRGIPCPSANDRKRNSHRSGLAWQAPTVRAILDNPRYTGYAVMAGATGSSAC